jgi:hypothetical protein
VPINDYNLQSLKIASFLLQLSLSICVNALFFTDETMHQIYSANGEFNIGYHISQIIYSFLISTVINTLIKQLSLFENNILSIKQLKLMKSAYKRAKDVRKLLIMKSFFFFILSFVLSIFFWYFISCFCAVYTNTQKILFSDSFISFGFSMLYPFFINLIPGIFRITALRVKNKKCIYKISQLLNIFL